MNTAPSSLLVLGSTFNLRAVGRLGAMRFAGLAAGVAGLTLALAGGTSIATSPMAWLVLVLVSR